LVAKARRFLEALGYASSRDNPARVADPIQKQLDVFFVERQANGGMRHAASGRLGLDPIGAFCASLDAKDKVSILFPIARADHSGSPILSDHK
jgi:hypothetical protein